jgi:DNA polymerase-1
MESYSCAARREDNQARRIVARIINTAEDQFPNDLSSGLWIYNALDCCVTLEVLEVLEPKLNEITQATYDFERSLLGPILEMQCRGIQVDQGERQNTARLYEKQLLDLETFMTDLLVDGIGMPRDAVVWQEKKKGKIELKYLWNSPARLQTLLYEVMEFPASKFRGKTSADRKALEKLKVYFYAEPIVNHVLAIRDIRKKLGVLRTGIDKDGRIRTSFNIAGTDTGRLASYVSSFGTGTNLQNITDELRGVFVADKGYKIGYVDLEQAEARGVGAIIWNLFHDPTYLDFCESGDLHTGVCKMTFNLPWTGDSSNDKALAKSPFYRHFDHRDAAKRLGHASNYFGKPQHISREVHIPLPLVQEFQRKYFLAFSGITKWHNWVRKKLLKDGWITTFMGRQRWFFGRRWDDETLRAAIAYEPQSVIADYINTGLHAVWRESVEGRLPVQLLLQVHDAIVFQYPEESEAEVIPKVQSLLEIEVPLNFGRTLKIPTEAQVGWNWAHTRNQKKELVNPNGLEVFRGRDARHRIKEVNILDRLIR